MDRDMAEFVVIDQLVPKEHLLRKVDAAVDFTRLYEMVEPLYCEDSGRPSPQKPDRHTSFPHEYEGQRIRSCCSGEVPRSLPPPKHFRAPDKTVLVRTGTLRPPLPGYAPPHSGSLNRNS